MGIQIASIRHNGSNIQQTIFVDWKVIEGKQTRLFYFQGVGFGDTVTVRQSFEEARETLNVWFDLIDQGEAVLRQVDSHSLRSQFNIFYDKSGLVA